MKTRLLRIRPFVLLLLTAGAVFVFSPAAARDFKYLTTRDGLSHNGVYSIAKDGEGLMWFSTGTGIDRYDGTSIRNYRLFGPEEDRSHIGRFNHVVTDPEQRIWAFNVKGALFRYDPRTDSFERRIEVPNSTSPTSMSLLGVCFSSGPLTLLYGSLGLKCYDREDNRLLGENLMPGIYVTKVVAVSDSLYAVGTADGFYLLKLDSPTDYRITRIEPERLDSRIQTLHYNAAADRLYLGTFNGRIFRYDLAQGILTQIVSISSNTPVRDLTEGLHHSLYIASDGMGIFVMDTRTEKIIRRYVATENYTDGLSANSIYDIYIDGENRLWIGTYIRGVCILDKNIPDFTYVTRRAGNNNSLNNNLVSTIMEDRDGDLWFGTDDGVSLYDTGTGRWHHLLNTRNNPDTRYKILALCDTGDGLVWAGGFACGAVLIDKRTLRVRTTLQELSKAHRGSGLNHVYVIYRDPSGDLWFGGLHGRVIRYDPASDDYREYKTRNVNAINSFAGSIVIGTARGIFRLDRQLDTFVPWPSENPDSPLLKSHINHLYPDGDRLWFSTEQGLGAYDTLRKKTFTYNREDGLVSDIVYAITGDRNGRIWVSSDRGLSCVDYRTGSFLNFNVGNGLKDDSFNTRAVCRTKDGKLWFGSYLGAVAFDPLLVHKINVRTKLYFSDFKISYRSVFEKNTEFRMTGSLNELSDIKLKYRQNTFSFAFAGINYTDASRLRYAWRLKGYDDQWLEQNGTPSANYANIPHGHYTFQVKALDTESGEALDYREIRIRITPPFWDSVWAWCLYLIVASMLTFGIYRIVHDRIERRHFAQKIRYFTDTAHEIKTPITLILGPLNKLAEETSLPPRDRDLLDIALKNTNKLSVFVNRLLDFQKAEMQAMKLVVTRHDAVSYMEERVNAFRLLAIQKQITLTFSSRLMQREVWFDAAKMETVVDNLLSNALKYSRAGDRVDVSLYPDEKRNGWTLEVRDTGIGISAESQTQLFKRFYRADNAVTSDESGSGIGLMLCQTLTRMMKGKISFESKLGEGSRFRLTFPYGNAHFRKENIAVAQPETVTTTADPAEAPAGVSATPQASPNTPTLLVVEDNDDLRRFISHCMNPYYRVAEAADGNEALRLLPEVKPDLILSDVMMPGMNGYELCSRVKGNLETSHIPVILITVLDEKSDMIEGYNRGADNYVIKPFDATLLKMKIDNSIRSRRALSERLMHSIGGSQQVSLENELDNRFIQEITQHLEEHLTDSEYSIDHLCKDMALSRSSFYNKIKALTNQSPNDFIRIFRLNKAAQLLRNGVRNVNEVAYATGFSDVKYFSTVFKKHYGMSPSKYVQEQ